jgi:hypothetical protein
MGNQGSTATPWAVICRQHGKQFLTHEEYQYQMNRPDSLWMCPICGESAWWDDDNYEAYENQEEESLEKAGLT